MHTHTIQMHWPRPQWGTWYSVRAVFSHVHAPTHGLESSCIYRQQRPWHGFKSRKYLLVQLRSMHCTQHEDNSLNVPVYNMHTTPRTPFAYTLRLALRRLHYRPHYGRVKTYLTFTNPDPRTRIWTWTRTRTKGDLALYADTIRDSAGRL